MAEVGFPGQHTTTTTITSSTTVQTNLRFDPSYLKTVPGILKIVQTLLSLLGFICIMASPVNMYSSATYYCWISMIAFWFTGILLGFYLFHLIEKLYKIPWLKIELLFCGLWAFLYLIAASLAASIHHNAQAAAAFFGFTCTVAYLADAFLKWRGVRAGALAQGARVVSKQTAAPLALGPDAAAPAAPPRDAY